MRDGYGNKLSSEEQQKVRSIQGAPDRDSVSGISVDPNAKTNTVEAEKRSMKTETKPAAGPGE